jgi:hypothetical protein
VSDYHSGGVSEAERTAVEAHLAVCTQCQQALAAYRRLYTLARSPLQLDAGGAEAWAPNRPFTEEETMTTTIDPNRDLEPTRIPYRQPPTALKTLGAIAAVLLVGALIGVLLARQGGLFQPAAQSTPTPHSHAVTPTPGLDAPTQAYVQVLHTYYHPFVQLERQESSQCYFQLKAAPAAQQPALMQACRPVEAAALSAAQALLTHMQATPPPARWKTVDTQLKQAVQGFVTTHTNKLAAIDAHDVNRFINANDSDIDPATATCTVFNTIHADLEAAGVPAESLTDLTPIDVTLCVGG